MWNLHDGIGYCCLLQFAASFWGLEEDIIKSEEWTSCSDSCDSSTREPIFPVVPVRDKHSYIGADRIEIILLPQRGRYCLQDGADVAHLEVT